MYHRAIIAVIAAMMSITISIGEAAENQSLKTNKKTVKKSVKCWKRQKPRRDELFKVKTGTASVCRVFEEVLNTSCEPPEKVNCNLALPQGEKRFHKLNWKQLDWREYWEMIHDWHIHNSRGFPEDMQKKEALRIHKLFEDGQSRLSVADVDIDNDGHSKQVVHWESVCDSSYGVLISGTKQLDWNYKSKLNPNISAGVEVMLYEGKVYLFGWKAVWNVFIIWNNEGSDVCQYKYLKGGAKK